MNGLIRLEDAIKAINDTPCHSESIRATFRCAISALEQEPCDDAEQIDYHDDFATALKKINDYEMTRDERAAISILNAYKEGYESAIEDYKQEPCEDAISRDAAIKTVHKMRVVCDTEDIDDYYELLVESFKQLPSVTQKSGVWVEIDDEPHEVWECDHCGFVIDGSGCIEPYEYRDIYKYCPNCGARMESEDKE